MIKRCICLIIAGIMVFSMSACSILDKTDDTTTQKPAENNNPPSLSVSNKDAKYEQRKFSNAIFLSKYDELYGLMRDDEFGAKYGPSDTYMREVDGNLIDSYTDASNMFFLTKDGLFEMQWDLTCTYKVPVELENAKRLVCANYSLALIEKEDGSFVAYEFDREENQPFRIINAKKLNIECEIPQDLVVKEFDFNLVHVVGVDKHSVQTIKISHDYSGNLLVTEDAIYFKRELTFDPVDFYIDNSAELGLYLIDENGNYYRCESVYQEDSYSKLLVTPYEPIKGIDRVLSSSSNQLVVTKNNDKSLYLYIFENWDSYSMFEFPISISNFDEGDIDFCINELEGYYSMTFVMNDGKIYRLDVSRLCYDDTHDHTNVKDFERYHSQNNDEYVQRYEYTKNGVFDGIFIVNKIHQAALEKIVTEDNIIYADLSINCLMMDDGYAYVFEN